MLLVRGFKVPRFGLSREEIYLNQIIQADESNTIKSYAQDFPSSGIDWSRLGTFETSLMEHLTGPTRAFLMGEFSTS